MTTNLPTVKIFIMLRQSVCGRQACSCSPTGQTEAQLHILQQTIKQAVNCRAEVYDVTSKEVRQDYPAIIDLLRSFGLTALPVITLNDEVVSVGTPSPNQIISAVWEKMSQLPPENVRD